MNALEQEAREWQAKAELALDKEREDLAKAALAEKARVAAAAEGAAHINRRRSATGSEKLNDDIVRLEEKLVDAKTRQQAISARHQTASRRLEVRKRLHSYKIDDALIRFDQFERRIDDLEAHAESYDLGAKKDLKSEFSDLENEDAVAKELRELKSKRAGQKRGGSTEADGIRCHGALLFPSHRLHDDGVAARDHHALRHEVESDQGLSDDEQRAARGSVEGQPADAEPSERARDDLGRPSSGLEKEGMTAAQPSRRAVAAAMT